MSGTARSRRSANSPRCSMAALAELSDAELLASLDRLGRRSTRLVDAIGVAATARRSTRRLRDGQSLSRRSASKTALDVVAERVGRAARRGAHLVPRRRRHGAAGESAPARCCRRGSPAVAAALRGGALGVADAEVVVRTVDEVRAVPVTVRAALRARGARWSSRRPDVHATRLRALCRRVPEQLVPEGVELREDLQRARSGVQIGTNRRRIVRVDRHDASRGGGLPDRRARRAHRTAPPADVRSPARGRRRRRPRCSHSRAATARRPRRHGARVARARPRSGRRHGGDDDGDGVARRAAHRHRHRRDRRGRRDRSRPRPPVGWPPTPRSSRACSADRARSSTRAARSGCSPRRSGGRWRSATAGASGRDAMLHPGWCEVAHLTSWLDGGPTDLSNGVLLCPFHHRRLDHDGWRFEWRAAELWLIPPAHVDASRAPRRAGRLRAGASSACSALLGVAPPASCRCSP